ATVEQGPSSSSRGPAQVGTEGAVSVPKPLDQRALPSGRWRNESKGSEYRFAADLSSTSKVPLRQIPSLDSVDMSQAPDLLFDSSHVRNSESGTSGRTDGTDEWRSEARGAPSEDLSIATGPSARAQAPAGELASAAMGESDAAAPARGGDAARRARAQALHAASAYAATAMRDGGARVGTSLA